MRERRLTGSRTHFYGRVHNITGQAIPCFPFGQQSFGGAWAPNMGQPITTGSNFLFLRIFVPVGGAVVLFSCLSSGRDKPEKRRLDLGFVIQGGASLVRGYYPALPPGLQKQDRITANRT